MYKVPPNSKYIKCTVHIEHYFFNKIKSQHNYNNNAFSSFLLQLYIIVSYKFTNFRNLIKFDMQNVSQNNIVPLNKY